MTPEAEAAVRIADKHLAGESADRRRALALDIMEAITRHAGTIATDVIREGFERARKANGARIR